MEATIQLPKAFSVRDEHELFPMQHLMARLNSKLMVRPVATGRHVSGSYTVFWGLVYLDHQPLSMLDVETALREAGFDFAHNKPLATPDFITDKKAAQRRAAG